jgi:hypothetical protein
VHRKAAAMDLHVVSAALCRVPDYAA